MYIPTYGRVSSTAGPWPPLLIDGTHWERDFELRFEDGRKEVDTIIENIRQKLIIYHTIMAFLFLVTLSLSLAKVA